MRRLIAYITMAAALVFGVAVNVIQPSKSIKPNLEYQQGREFVYRVELKDDTMVELPSTAAEEIAQVMDTRMQTYGLSEYTIAQEGNNIVRTTTALSSEMDYNRLQVFLNYNANFTIKVGDDDNTEAIMHADEIFDGVQARVEFRRAYPFIIFPLSNPELFKTNIFNIAEAIQNEKGETNEEGEQDLVKEATIVLWTDYDPDADSYLNPQGDTGKKVFLEFDFRNMWWDEEQTEIAVLSPLDGAQEGNYTTRQIREATETAFFMANLFNAGTLDYKVDFLFQNTAHDPTVEPLINLQTRDHIAMSATLFAIMASIIVTLLISFLIYRLPVVTALSSGALTLLGTLLIFNAVLVEVTTSAIIGFALVGLVPLGAVLLYAARFREEVYRGRTFKKAHQEAIRRTTFMTLDFQVIMVIVGVFTYFFGGAALTGFATTLIFGAIVSTITVLLHNSLMLWLLANNTNTQKAYKMYGIKAEAVPNLLKEEKQSYFGRFFEHNPSAKSKLYLGGFGALALAAIVLISVFSGINKSPFNLVKYEENVTRIYFQVNEDSIIRTNSQTNSPLKILELITVDGEPLKLVSDQNGNAIYETKQYETFETTLEGDEPVTYNFYVYSIISPLNFEDVNVLVEYQRLDVDVEMQSGNLFDALTAIVEGVDARASISVNKVYKEAITPRFDRVALISLITLTATSLYMAMRYGLSRGITNFAQSLSAASAVLVFFIVTRIAVPPLVTLGALVATLFIAYLNIIYFNKIKDVKNDQLYRDLTRREHYGVALRLSLSSLYIVTLVFGTSLLLFTLLAPLSVSSVYLSSFLALIVSLLVQTKFSSDVLSASVNFQGRLAKIQLPKRKQKVDSAKQKQRTSRKSSTEPEEAIYIGIND